MNGCTLIGQTILLAMLAGGASAQDALRINHTQAIGTHNSYHIAPQGEQRAMILEYDRETFEAINYTHPPLDVQLENGVRSFELDIVYQPEGFVTVHVPEIDFETNCPTFIDCLETMKRWSLEHASHIPIMVLVQVKDSFSIELQETEIYPTNGEILDQMDEALLSVFDRNQLITPDDIRGDYATLEEAVLKKGWPSLDEGRGRFLFAFHDSPEKMDIYAEGRPSLEGRPMFATTSAGRPDAAILVVNDPNSDEIPQLLEAGYLVRTRADSGVREPRLNDRSRFEQAMKSGAHYIHTDFPKGQPHPETGYEVVFPDGGTVRCNPLLAPGNCAADELEPGIE